MEIARLLEFLNVPQEDLARRPRFPEKHHLLGNKMLQGFEGDIRLSTEWQEALSEDEKRDTLKRAGALARKLGYA